MVVLRYLRHIAGNRNLADNTVEQHTNVLRRLRRWNGGPLLYLDRERLEAWQYSRSAAGVAASTIAGELSVIRAFYRWAMRNDLLDVDPTVHLVIPRVPRRLPRPMTEERFVLAMESADSVMRAILGLAGWAGARAVDIARADWSGVDPRSRTIRVVSKGDRERVLPYPAELTPFLLVLPRNGPAVIPRRDGQPRHNAPHTISHHANAFLHSIGIPDTLHSLRHTFGTNFLAETGNLRLTQEAMGHATPATTAIYTQINVDELRVAVDLAARRLRAPDPPDTAATA